MNDEAAQRVRLMRYELYSRAMDEIRADDAAAVLPKLLLETHGCRRAAEAIELAEFHVAFRFPKRGIEHFVRQLGRCSDCGRAQCVAEEPRAAHEDAVATGEAQGGAGLPGRGRGATT